VTEGPNPRPRDPLPCVARRKRRGGGGGGGGVWPPTRGGPATAEVGLRCRLSRVVTRERGRERTCERMRTGTAPRRRVNEGPKAPEPADTNSRRNDLWTSKRRSKGCKRRWRRGHPERRPRLAGLMIVNIYGRPSGVPRWCRRQAEMCRRRCGDFQPVRWLVSGLISPRLVLICCEIKILYYG